MGSKLNSSARDEIVSEVERIVHSKPFSGSPRAQLFLRYVVGQALSETPDLKEYSIAIEVFGKDSTYDPQVDATVRVEASRLRTRLRDYYAGDGSTSTLRIEIPKGGYAPVFISTPALAPPPSIPPPLDTVHPPPPRRSAPNSTMVLLMLAATVLGGMFWAGRSRVSATSAPVSDKASLAVLPFANNTGDKGNDYLSDGLTEDFIRHLSEIPNLRVTSRTSVLRLRGQAQDVRNSGRTLGVGSILTGNIQRTNGRLLVNAELSTVSDGSVIFSRQYLPDGSDIQPTEADVIHDIIEGLKLGPGARESGESLRKGAFNPEAYRWYLMGEQAARGNSPAELNTAIGFFQKAVSLDPGFDIAWVGMAQAHALLGIYYDAPAEHMPKARELARHALKLNNSLSEAHGIVGTVSLLYDWDLPAAERELSLAGPEKRAINVLSCTAHLLERTGRPRNAEEVVNSMIAYDPLNAGLIAELGCIQYYRRNFDDAVKHYRAAEEMDSTTPLAAWGLAKSLALEGHYQDAIAELDRFRARNGFEPPLLTAERGYAEGAWGRTREAEAAITQLKNEGKTGFIDPYLIATIYLSDKRLDLAFEWLQKAFEIRSAFLISILSDPKWDSVQNDPRFHKIVEKMGNGAR